MLSIPVLAALAGFVALLALVAIVLLVRGRSSGAERRGPARLSVVDAAIVDNRRRLVLVRRDQVEHLLLIGGPSDVIIESSIARARPAGQAAGQRAGALHPAQAAQAAQARPAVPAPERRAPAAPQPAAPPRPVRPAEARPEEAPDPGKVAVAGLAAGAAALAAAAGGRVRKPEPGARTDGKAEAEGEPAAPPAVDRPKDESPQAPGDRGADRAAPGEEVGRAAFGLRDQPPSGGAPEGRAEAASPAPAKPDGEPVAEAPAVGDAPPAARDAPVAIAPPPPQAEAAGSAAPAPEPGGSAPDPRREVESEFAFLEPQRSGEARADGAAAEAPPQAPSKTGSGSDAGEESEALEPAAPDRTPVAEAPAAEPSEPAAEPEPRRESPQPAAPQTQAAASDTASDAARPDAGPAAPEPALQPERPASAAADDKAAAGGPGQVATIGDLAERLEEALIQKADPGGDGAQADQSDQADKAPAPAIEARLGEADAAGEGAQEPAAEPRPAPREARATIEKDEGAIIDFSARRKSADSLEEEMARLLGELTRDTSRR